MSNYLSRLAVRSAGIAPQPHNPGNAASQPGSPVFDPFETVAPDVTAPLAAGGTRVEPSQGLPLPAAPRPNMPGQLDVTQAGAALADQKGFVQRADFVAPVMPVEAANLSKKSEMRPAVEVNVDSDPRTITPPQAEARPEAVIEVQKPATHPVEFRVQSGRMEDLWTAEKQAQALQAMQERWQGQLAEGVSDAGVRSMELQPQPEAARSLVPTAPQEVRPSAPPSPVAQPEPAAPHLVIGSLRVEVLPAAPQPQAVTVIHRVARGPLAPPSAPSGLRFGLGQM